MTFIQAATFSDVSCPGGHYQLGHLDSTFLTNNFDNVTLRMFSSDVRAGARLSSSSPLLLIFSSDLLEYNDRDQSRSWDKLVASSQTPGRGRSNRLKIISFPVQRLD